MIIQYPPLIVVPSEIAHNIGAVRMQAIATLTGRLTITGADGEKYQGNHDKTLFRPEMDYDSAVAACQMYIESFDGKPGYDLLKEVVDNYQKYEVLYPVQQPNKDDPF